MNDSRNDNKKEIHFLFNGQDVVASQGDTLLESLIKCGIAIDHSCGGNASCGTCQVFVEKGEERLSDPNELESEFINERGLAAHTRLACQTEAKSELILRKTGLNRSK